MEDLLKSFPSTEDCKQVLWNYFAQHFNQAFLDSQTTVERTAKAAGLLAVDGPDERPMFRDLAARFRDLGLHHHAKVTCIMILRGQLAISTVKGPSVLDTAIILGLILTDEMDWRAAEALFNEILKSGQADSLVVANAHNILGYVYRGMLRNDLSKAHFLHALRIMEQQQSSDHRQVFSIKANLASLTLLEVEGEALEAAENELRQVVETSAAQYGMNDAATLLFCTILGNHYALRVWSGEWRALNLAEEQFSRAYEGYRESFGEAHKVTREVAFRLCKICAIRAVCLILWYRSTGEFRTFVASGRTA
ncbi:hypothetical protein CABS01_16771 [Colletotrichum abscissum]|uniref:Uncharacterized protein n=1 Tax=Colletotrichum abscissum TaxID=1671311 RepID=A0A9P9X3F3_9PEZI|nr:uncharacterized protein CABS01_16771 [Colletotrichum abscissum]KAI3534621.1 hypothetical protein CABS02_13202 [Colletotrichum abscissum]KAK1513938.1 hypothetical protein CABS01_16771 [Colletotrichum abscissum]